MKNRIGRLRPINLVIVALTQLFFTYIVLFPALGRENISSLDQWINAVIILITLVVTAGGYIINDIFDKEIDLINKPQKAIRDVAFWNRSYKALFLLGFVLVSILSYHFGHPYFMAIYLLAWLSLHRYSSSWKCKPLIGNLVVSLFSASVILVVLAPYISDLALFQAEELDQIIRPFSYYFIFAFFTSLVREIVKDMEDHAGDQAAGCNTIAVSIGIPRTIFLTQLIIINFLACFLIWQYQFVAVFPLWSSITLNLVILGSYLYFILRLNRASYPKAYRKLRRIFPNAPFRFP